MCTGAKSLYLQRFQIRKKTSVFMGSNMFSMTEVQKKKKTWGKGQDKSLKKADTD